ncbi:MAG: PilZ domain-containing protein [Deltaproteobacteria bacterium]|nr:PilZ domain-containing protein [Deltaproteobacteria bacterium]
MTFLEGQGSGAGKPFRAHKRHNVELRVHYEGEAGYIEQVVGNISLGGLRISGPITDVVGDHVELSILLPHLSQPVPVRGEVVWVEREGGGPSATVGVRFVDLTPDLKVLLGAVLRASALHE